MANAALLMFFLLSSTVAFGSEFAHVEDALEQHLPTMQVEKIVWLEDAQLYEVRVGMNLYYLSENAELLVQGPIYRLEDKTNLTEEHIKPARSAALAALDDQHSQRFGPADAKSEVVVFTALSCGFCGRLHRALPEFEKQGIAFRYVMLPRGGPGSDAYRKTVNAWCSADRADAIDKAFRGAPAKPSNCAHTLESQRQLATSLGVNSTPTLFLPDGSKMLGYQSAETVAQELSAAK